MKDKKIEEKSKKYADNILPNANDVGAGYEQYLYWKYSKFGYYAGYNQALTDQSDTLTQYKEALRGFIDIEERVLGINKNKTWVSETEILQVIDKAKQLLKDE